MIGRGIFSAIVVALWVMLYNAYKIGQGAIEGPAAVGQLEDHAATYAASKFVVDGGYMALMTMAALCILAIIWSKYLVKIFKSF